VGSRRSTSRNMNMLRRLVAKIEFRKPDRG
jgi:hypothetical protein